MKNPNINPVVIYPNADTHKSAIYDENKMWGGAFC
jgi:hypothetical protein